MGKRRAAVGAAAALAFPFPAAAAQPPDRHFSDYGFDQQLVRFFSQPEAKRPSTRRHRHQPPPPLESARFKLQKPISKKQHQLHRQQQGRRRWWSSAASAALLLFKFKRPSSKPNPTAAVAPASPLAPLYLAGDDDGPAACTCWSPAMRSGHLAADELGAAAASAVPYVSLRNAAGGGGAAAAAAPAMPIYLVT